MNVTEHYRTLPGNVTRKSEALKEDGDHIHVAADCRSRGNGFRGRVSVATLAFC